MRASTNITLKERKVLELREFKGVDLSSTATNVRSDRASYARNFINDNGVNQKRHGWDEILYFNGERINGIFEYKTQDVDRLIVHVNNLFYEVNKTEHGYTSRSLYSYGANVCERTQAFMSRGKLYIIGVGAYIVYGEFNGKYEIKNVSDIAYVPTVRIGVSPSVVYTTVENGVEKEEYPENNSVAYDNVNLLTSKVKYKLRGVSKKAKWKLPRMYSGSGVIIKIDTCEGENHVLLEGKDEDSNLVLTKKTLYNDNGTTEVTEYTLRDGMVLGTISKKTGEIVLNQSAPFNENDNTVDNIDAEFVSYDLARNGVTRREKVTKCKFGCLFGVDGNNDRLFLSGNEQYPNVDFYSAMDDFSYFEDIATASYGSDAFAVKGYARLTDGTLAVLKESNGQETSIYYRTGRYDTGSDGRITAVFPVKAGNSGEGCVSIYATANLYGDPLFLSKNGVYGIQLTNNITTYERYARMRSKTINGSLKEHDLSNAVGYAHNGRYYLAVDGICYVADSRFKYQDGTDDSYNYEWWYWDNIPARVFSNIGGELVFGTEDGKICKFDESYVDKTYTISKKGDISVNTSDYTITVNQDLDLKEGDEVELFTNEMYPHGSIFTLIGEVSITDGIVGRAEKEVVSSLYDGMEVIVDYDGFRDKHYYVKFVDNRLFVLEDEKGTDLFSQSPLSFNLLKEVCFKKLYVKDYNDGTFNLAEVVNGAPIPIVRLGNSIGNSGLGIKVTHKENVVAEWRTPALDLGTNESSKTLLKMVISTTPEANGKISFGYETKSLQKFIDGMAHLSYEKYKQRLKLLNGKGLNVFSLDEFSFEDFTFNTGFSSSYSVQVNERNFNYIMFRFYSEEDKNCIIDTFTAVYKINKKNKGVT